MDRCFVDFVEAAPASLADATRARLIRGRYEGENVWVVSGEDNKKEKMLFPSMAGE